MMRLLCKKYSQYFIAVLMLSVLYGRSIVCVKSVVFSAQYVSAEEYGEGSSQDGENEKEGTVKSCKKSWVEMEYGQMIIPSSPLQWAMADMMTHHQCSALARLYQRVPTPPPLQPVA
ncbi:hypothetical protein LZZ85_20700 [Terrimonas sp. NA20]|uniref:DUF305 domain-containing protein n=1 Tax=Terrimonas ginsenosidimutans TaxID=2908004 RepID=A0ABS9KWK2_9BACT|nr:hypothetical protein [Terrimonas ginsenosidimutans]MCG2616731.1 hypothetical protein [Terrimonas ginsenosidimutans]